VSGSAEKMMTCLKCSEEFEGTEADYCPFCGSGEPQTAGDLQLGDAQPLSRVYAAVIEVMRS
jgi:Zn finger protein HypA/HybF involved in hydrogenase expression